MSPLLCLVISLLLFAYCESQRPIGDWQDGRSTFYTAWDGGNCDYGHIPSDRFPYSNIAAVNTAFYDNSTACGNCYEVRCTGPWDKEYCPEKQACLHPNDTVIIEVTDQCPAQTNQEWCNGDMVHFDLSSHAYDLLADQECGVIKMQYRQVTCNYGAGENIKIINGDGINVWWYELIVSDVDGYGGISNVEIKDKRSMPNWTAGVRQDYNAWLWDGDGTDGVVMPISVKITDSHNNSLQAEDIVTSDASRKIFDFGTNFYNLTFTKKRKQR